MTHPCNNPNLSPIEFLEAVMHDDTFSMPLRVKAPAALTSIHTKAPQSPITIHIKDAYCHEYLARFPWLKEFAAKDPEQINGKSQSFSSSASNNPHPRCGDPGPPNIETTSNSPTLIDYSKPPTPDEIQQIKAAVHALQPDFDPSQPVPLYLSACGRWLTFRCNCVIVH